MIFYLFSTAFALYATGSLTFRTYKMDCGKPTDKRVVFPNIVYLLMFVACFVPILNFILDSVFIFISIMGRYVFEDFYVKSRLFDKPKQKEEADDSAK